MNEKIYKFVSWAVLGLIAGMLFLSSSFDVVISAFSKIDVSAIYANESLLGVLSVVVFALLVTSAFVINSLRGWGR